jgi:hypothetical protein
MLFFLILSQSLWAAENYRVTLGFSEKKYSIENPTLFKSLETLGGSISKSEEGPEKDRVGFRSNAFFRDYLARVSTKSSSNPVPINATSFTNCVGNELRNSIVGVNNRQRKSLLSLEAASFYCHGKARGSRSATVVFEKTSQRVVISEGVIIDEIESAFDSVVGGNRQPSLSPDPLKVHQFGGENCLLSVSNAACEKFRNPCDVGAKDSRRCLKNLCLREDHVFIGQLFTYSEKREYREQIISHFGPIEAAKLRANIDQKYFSGFQKPTANHSNLLEAFCIECPRGKPNMLGSDCIENGCSVFTQKWNEKTQTCEPLKCDYSFQNSEMSCSPDCRKQCVENKKNLDSHIAWLTQLRSSTNPFADIYDITTGSSGEVIDRTLDGRRLLPEEKGSFNYNRSPFSLIFSNAQDISSRRQLLDSLVRTAKNYSDNYKDIIGKGCEEDSSAELCVGATNAIYNTMQQHNQQECAKSGSIFNSDRCEPSKCSECVNGKDAVVRIQNIDRRQFANLILKCGEAIVLSLYSRLQSEFVNAYNNETSRCARGEDNFKCPVFLGIFESQLTDRAIRLGFDCANASETPKSPAGTGGAI